MSEIEELRRIVEEQGRQIAALDRTIRSVKGMTRGEKGERGEPGRDGRDGRSLSASSPQTPVIVNQERPKPVSWEFKTDAQGVTVARPLGAGL